MSKSTGSRTRHLIRNLRFAKSQSRRPHPVDARLDSVRMDDEHNPVRSSGARVRRILIRQLKGQEEFRACERIQKAVWGSVGVSGELMSVTQKYGGAVLGSLVNGRVAGFIFAFLATRKGRLIHWSHLMAVESRFRDLGLGFRMKLAHRKLALGAGISSICWTYDPLQSRNAALNIGRLGG